MNGSWVIRFLEQYCLDDRCVISYCYNSVTLGKIKRDDKERHCRWDERSFFRSPKQEDKHLIFNLSTKRALCVGAEPAEVGPPILLYVTLPNLLAELKLAGKVRWVKKLGQNEEGLYLTGIQFEGQDEATAGILKAYLQFLQRDRILQKSKSVTIGNLEILNRLVRVVFLKKEELLHDFQ